ncbi:YjgP/YjgQ family permease [Thermosulfuriphilus ammonigenes]|uniref:YjgP/YjgQ family permease n=1 Tax=Thermosulfuriphilus ammonigenes TaxID=1936021 RepID=A0A6G7PTZ9_9BACT|nr:LptF/LptG family permease [Thermosulfuriphilus ammonigenes]MBA2848841.1 lipopolysaccharide export system permease protein [Thermosulfuriphilus ammonigenes]QIJ71036.1 YjgP/YjgQ family permease [Thermosulfuriphilus ammonigenes]
MRLISRYILQEYLRVLSILAPAVVGLYLLVDFFEKLDEFMAVKGGLSLAWRYYLYRVPAVIEELLPLVLFLSALITLALLARGHELLALRACGFSPWEILAPLVLTTLAMATLSIPLSEALVPWATAKAEELWQVELKKERPRGILIGERLYFKGEDGFYLGLVLDPEGRRLKDFCFLAVSSYPLPRLILWAKEATWEGGVWRLKDGEKRQLEQQTYQRSLFEEKLVSLKASPEDFLALKRPPEVKDLFALWGQIELFSRAGLKTAPLVTEFFRRIIYPFMAPALFLLGGTFFVSRRGKHIIATGISLGLVLGVAAWIIWGLANTLATSGRIYPPLVVATPPLLFALGGLWLLKKSST